MTKAVRLLVLSVLLLVLGYLVWPWLSLAIYAARLAYMPAPGSLSIPVANVKPRELNNTWHASRPPARRHEGIDIFAKKGTPVIASTEGIVLRRDVNNLGGKVVWVFGPGGQHHYYAHLDDFAGAAPKERIEVGALLGYVGNTGNARTTPPHLHYGIYTNAGPINPYPLLVPDRKTYNDRR